MLKFVYLKNILLKIQIFYLIFWIVVGSWWYYYLFQKQTASTTTTSSTSIEVVWTWSLSETIDVVWTSELVDEQSLSFNQAWTVVAVYFKAWDTVKKWDIIAELDNTDWENSVKQAELSLEDAKIALTQLYDTADESQILQSKKTIESTQNSIDIAKQELETLKQTQTNTLSSLQKDIDNAKSDLEISKKSLEVSKKELETSKTSLELSKNDLELAKKELELTIQEQENSLSNTTSNKSTTIKQIENSFVSDLTSISKIIEQLDYILWVTEANKNKNDGYETFLWAKNSVYKTEAESALSKSISEYIILKNVVYSYGYTWDINEIKNILKEFKNVYNSLEDSTDLTYKTLENTIGSSNLSENEIESKKTTVYSYLTTVQSKLNSITSSINTLNTLTNTDLIISSNNNSILSLQNSIAQKEASIKSSEISIESKENTILSTENSIVSKQKDIEKQIADLETTKKTYETNLKSKENNIWELEKTLSINKESYNELIDWPTDKEVRKATNNVTQAELKLENAMEALDDYKLESPFDWVVRKIDYMVWDNLNNDTDKSVYIENPDMLQITVMLDQVDIAKVKVWTKAKVVFDAYSTEEADAVITWIDTTPTQSSWVTSYEVTLILNDEDFDKEILSWMTWDVEIITNQSENAIIVSSSAITTENDKSYVTIMNNWKGENVEVTTWMVSSWKTEITSWLSVWDKVIIINYSSSTSSSSKTTSTSLFWWWNNSWRSSWMWAWWPPGWF